jgi:hypothetical protein
MKILIFIFFIIICNSYSIFAISDYPTKDDSTKQIKTIENKNWLYGELGGNGGILSVNYERFLSKKVSIRIGLGTSVIIVAAAIPIMVNYSYKNVLEIGAGVVPFLGAATGEWRSKIFAGKENGLLLTAVIGFKRINRGFLFKLSLTPFFNPDGSNWGLTGGISFGFSL